MLDSCQQDSMLQCMDCMYNNMERFQRVVQTSKSGGVVNVDLMLSPDGERWVVGARKVLTRLQPCGCNQNGSTLPLCVLAGIVARERMAA